MRYVGKSTRNIYKAWKRVDDFQRGFGTKPTDKETWRLFRRAVKIYMWPMEKHLNASPVEYEIAWRQKYWNR